MRGSADDGSLAARTDDGSGAPTTRVSGGAGSVVLVGVAHGVASSAVSNLATSTFIVVANFCGRLGGAGGILDAGLYICSCTVLSFGGPLALRPSLRPAAPGHAAHKHTRACTHVQRTHARRNNACMHEMR